MPIGASETAIALKLLETAKRQGWLDRLITALKKKHRVLVLGCSGAGKSMFLESLAETLPAAISRLNRTEFATQHAIKVGKSPFVFVDTPGQVLHKSRRIAAIQEALRKPVAGVINVTAFGYHEGKPDKKHAIEAGRARPSFLEDCRRDEIDALGEWLPWLGSRESADWLMTIVSKADLWWSDRERVLEHYAAGEYAQALTGVAHLNPVVLEYSSVFQPYYGDSPLDGHFGDADRLRVRGHLVKQLLAAVGQPVR